MDDLFFVIQLYSYPGDYVAERPVIERIAETLDKFEEDVLQATYPQSEDHDVSRPIRGTSGNSEGTGQSRCCRGLDATT